MTRLLRMLALPAFALAACGDDGEAKTACQLLHDRCPPTTVFIAGEDTAVLDTCEQRSASATNLAEVEGCLRSANECRAALDCANRLK